MHLGKFVAEIKYRANEEIYNSLISAKDSKSILETLTDANVELVLLERVHRKTDAYRSEGGFNGSCVDGKVVQSIYEEFIIPLTKHVEVQYLLQRLSLDAEIEEDTFNGLES